MQGSKQSICDGYIMELLLGGLSLALGKVWCSAVGVNRGNVCIYGKSRSYYISIDFGSDGSKMDWTF